MEIKTIKVSGRDVRAGDTLFDQAVEESTTAVLDKDLQYVRFVGGTPVWLLKSTIYTVTREVNPTRFKVGTLVRQGTDHLIRREGDWMGTLSGRTFWYLPEGDEYVQKNGWTIVYGGPEDD